MPAPTPFMIVVLLVTLKTRVASFPLMVNALFSDRLLKQFPETELAD